MLRLAPLWALLVAGCAARPLSPPTAAVVVTTLDVDFPSRERGFLRFGLRLPPGTPPVAQVSWELFLDGVRFAAGLDGDVGQGPSEVKVETPLVCRHLAWREGEAPLDVAVRGEVDVGIPGGRLPFRERREVPVHGRPLLNIPLD